VKISIELPKTTNGKDIYAKFMPWEKIGQIRKGFVSINEFTSGIGPIKPQGNKLVNVLKLMVNVGNKILCRLVA